MNDKFESQKETLISIKQEISLLYQQVNYLLRNEKPLELLDLDVLMNRTHTLYDQLCSINVGDESLDEDLPFDADDLAGLFGGMTQDAPAENTDEAPVVMEFATPTEKAEEVAPEPEPENQPLADDFGIFLHFENIPEEEKTPETKRDEQGRLVHVMEAVPEELIPERDRVHGEDLVKDNPLVMPRLDDERKAEKAEIEQQASGGMSGFFEQDDTGFELSTGETLGEKMMGEDNSLAAKLQQNPVRDLKSVIGINDKFLFVNELFGGSMEKYNKSIENLNDLKTLNGAMIYLNELKIELQWNSSNEAYLKLKELITRKFE